MAEPTRAVTSADQPAEPVDRVEPVDLVAAMIAATAKAPGLAKAPGSDKATGTAEAGWWDTLLAATTPSEALAVWLAAVGLPPEQRTKARVARLLNHQVAALDELLTEQVNAVLHHERFQSLEAAWRSLWSLVEQAEDANDRLADAEQDSRVVVRVLNVNKRELYKDLAQALEFDQSRTFTKIYESEFGTAGGTPYGLLVGDYQFTRHIEDLELLERMSEVAAASFAPFIAGADPDLLGLPDFSLLARPIDLASGFQRPELLKWRTLRERNESHFLGLVLPRIVLRGPYQDDGSCQPGFRYAENLAASGSRDVLWGNAAFAFAGVVVRAFGECGWFADIRGREPLSGGGGQVPGLPPLSSPSQRPDFAPLLPTETALADAVERELGDLGMIPLVAEAGGRDAVFYSNASVHLPTGYTDPLAQANARLSAMLQYVLCASRFAHYIKVLARDKVGSTANARDLEDSLHRWVVDYVTPDDLAPAHIKAQRPLREASVGIQEVPGRPGRFDMVLHLVPHYQLDQLTVSLKMVTRLG